MFTSMTSASKPHHVVDADGVTLGYTHFGMLAAARWIRAQVPSQLSLPLSSTAAICSSACGAHASALTVVAGQLVRRATVCWWLLHQLVARENGIVRPSGGIRSVAIVCVRLAGDG
jgi:hypothetical protein